jgi:hypothetical protein
MTDVAEGQPVDHTHEPQLPPPAEPQDGQVPPQGPPPPPLVTECAFLVYLDEHGHWVAEGNITRQVTKAREANFVDFHNACTTIVKDVVVMETANRVVLTQQQAAMQAAEAMRTRELARQIGGPVGEGLGMTESGLIAPR